MQTEGLSIPGALITDSVHKTSPTPYSNIMTYSAPNGNIVSDADAVPVSFSISVNKNPKSNIQQWNHKPTGEEIARYGINADKCYSQVRVFTPQSFTEFLKAGNLIIPSILRQSCQLVILDIDNPSPGEFVSSEYFAWRYPSPSYDADKNCKHRGIVILSRPIPTDEKLKNGDLLYHRILELIGDKLPSYRQEDGKIQKFDDCSKKHRQFFWGVKNPDTLDFFPDFKVFDVDAAKELLELNPAKKLISKPKITQKNLQPQSTEEQDSDSDEGEETLTTKILKDIYARIWIAKEVCNRDFNKLFCKWDHKIEEIPCEAGIYMNGQGRAILSNNPGGSAFWVSQRELNLPPVFQYRDQKLNGSYITYWWYAGKLLGQYPKDMDLKGKNFIKVVTDIYNHFGLEPYKFKKDKNDDDDERNIWEIYADMLTNEFGSDGIRLNKMSLQIEVDGDDVDYESLRSKLARQYKLPFKKKEVFAEVLRDLALENQYHPVKDYLESLPKSSNPNILNNLSTRHLGTESPLYDEYLKKTLVGAVARIFEPGCQLDTVCVLQGLQGVGKSTFWKTLAFAKTKKWFNNNLCTDNGDKDDLLKLRKSWIHELAELDGIFKKKEVQKMRNFITTTTDNFRAPYSRAVESFDRMSILVGTVNNKEFLNDPDGNRRIWVIPVNGKIDISLLDKEVNELWSAALYWYKKGYQYYLSDEQEEQRKLINAEFEEVDAIEDKVIPIARAAMHFTLAKLMCDCNYKDEDRSLQMRISNILKKHGFSKKRMSDGKGGKATYWQNPIYDPANPLASNSVD